MAKEPAMLVPVRFRYGQRWALDIAVRLSVSTDKLGLTGVRIENAQRFYGSHAGDCPSMEDVIGEAQQSARFITLLLRDGTTAREIEARLHPFVGEHVVEFAGSRFSGASIGGALVMAAVHAEHQLENSALADRMARAGLSEMG